jgi:hypothetical protein
MAVVSVALLSADRSFGADPVRPIHLIPAAERLRLPDTTKVTLASGRTATLGALRLEHTARMARIAKVPPRAQPDAGALTPAGIKLSLARIPFQAPKHGSSPLPKDYLEFCAASQATACAFLPGSTTYDFEDPSSPTNTSWFIAEDPLIHDEKVCAYGGGVYSPSPADTCRFYYPWIHVVNFLPTGPVTATATCDAGDHLVDPKGAIRVAALHTNIPHYQLYTGPAPVGCVVQASYAPK